MRDPRTGYTHRATKQPGRCDVQLLRVFSPIIYINRPDGATYSQTVYVPKYSPRAFVVSAIVGS